MNNRFGFKDFLQLVLVGAVLVLVLLSMLQRDREWVLQKDILDKLGGIEKKLAQGGGASGDIAAKLAAIEDRLAKGVVAVAGGAASGAAVAAGSPAPGGDESWARPGVKVEWQEPWNYATDPHGRAGFAEGGEFTEIFEGQPAKITPMIASDVYGRRVIDRVCDSLGAYDPKTLRFRGLLAAAWQQDPAGTWIRVRLRSGLRWSDGEPITAEDVRWTFDEYVFNPSVETERVRSTLDQIKSTTVLDPLTVEFQFTKSLSFNLEYTLGVYVLPKHFYGRLQASQINSATGLLMGSGPFKL